MSEPRALVELFFRHESGRVGAVLTLSLGVRRLEFVEDVVQAALVQALETWSRRGVPEDPAGWLYRTARNLAIDALRRERTHAQALPRLAEDAERESSPLEAHFADEIVTGGDANLVFIAREMLREPYWASKAQQALGEEPAWPIQYGYAVKRRAK